MVSIGITIPGRSVASNAPTTPLSIFGAGNVLQWVRADLGVTIGTGVSAWADQSGNGKDYTQATGANQPVYNSSDATLSYLPTVEATANGQTLASSLALPNATVAPWSVIVVAKFNTGPSLQVLVCTDPGNTRPFIYTDSGGTNLHASGNGGDISNLTSVAVWNRLRADFSNIANDILKVGSNVVTGNIVNGVGTASTNRSLFSGNSNYCRAKVFEIVYLNKVATPSEMSAYDAYVTAITNGAAAV